jgi:hypothetical protein
LRLSGGDELCLALDANLPDTTKHRLKAYVAAGAACKNETFNWPGSWQSFEMSSSKMVRAEGAAMLCVVLPIVGGRDTAIAARWPRKGKHNLCYLS